MAYRYTRKMLEEQVAQINKVNSQNNDWRRFVVGNYAENTTVHIAAQWQVDRRCTQESLEAGTPRQCIQAVYREMSHRHEARRTKE